MLCRNLILRWLGRNPDIAHCCLIRKYVEIVGSGILRMISECQRLGFESPQWIAANNSISLIFNNLLYSRERQ